jgi:CDP-diacylglycerol--serine O-phosphatidyltransferase
VCTVALFGLVISFPFEALALTTVMYLALIPLGVAQYRRLNRASRRGDVAATSPVPSSDPGEVPPAP